MRGLAPGGMSFLPGPNFFRSLFSPLKGTGFSPYVSGCKQGRLQPLRGLISIPLPTFSAASLGGVS